MAKFKVTEYEKTIKLSRRELVCEKCGTTSGKYGMTGRLLLLKWENRPWLCHDCDPNYGKRGIKPLCACGHRKTDHSGGKYKCHHRRRDPNRQPAPYIPLTDDEWGKLAEGPVKEYRAAKETEDRHRAETRYRLFACDCKRYLPQETK